MVRKFLNLPNNTQKLVLKQETDSILNKCDLIAISEYDEQLEAKQIHDNRCPKCRNNEKIVDKITCVQGVGKSSGVLYFGFGNIQTNITIDTLAVNHCSNCGHEWIKFKTKYVSGTKILWVVLNYLADILSDDKEKNHSWKIEAIQTLDGCHAETIYKLCLENKNYLHDKTNSILTLSRLRQYYQSIYDEENKKKLKII